MDPSKLSEDQIERMTLVVEALAKRGNAAATGVIKAIRGRPADQRRRLLCGFYATLFEVLSCLQMAVDSKVSAAELKAALRKRP